MKAIILKKKILDEVYSASGIENLNGQLYIIGDDSPFLYKFDYNGELVDKIEMFASYSQSAGRIPKKEKPDLETLTSFSYQERNYLLTLGSGSKGEIRDKAYLIDSQTFAVKELSLNSLYNLLRNDEEVVGLGKLNIEGLCTTEKEMILMARGNISGRNITLKFDFLNFLRHFLDGEKLERPSILKYQLPIIEGWAAGFSGADYDPKTDTVYFTAAVEATLNEIDDGISLGSYVGKIYPSRENALEICPIEENGEIFKGKVESITLTEDPSILLAVTDTDGGDSELIWLKIVE